jgi:hypothetical protein
MLFECWIIKAIDKHSEYVILIAFLQQHWLGEHVSLLRVYIYFLSFFYRRATDTEHILLMVEIDFVLLVLHFIRDTANGFPYNKTN